MARQCGRCRSGGYILMAGQCGRCRGVWEQERGIKWGKGRRDRECSIRKLRRGGGIGNREARRNREWEREGRTRVRIGRRRGWRHEREDRIRCGRGVS